MIYYVYLTSNLVNGKFYIGKHASEKFDTTYFGSGVMIKKAVKKYGTDNFEVQIIQTFDTEDDAYDYERKIIKEFLDESDCYNLVDGGRGFTSRSGKEASDKAKELGWFGFKSMPFEKQQEIASKGGIKGAEICRKLNKGMFCMTYEQRKVWAKENNKDRQWITNGSNNLRIKKCEPVPEGWVIGRSNVDMSSRLNYLCWTDGKINVFSYTCPGDEFKNGMIKKTPSAKFPWWNNGKINKRCFEKPGDDFIPGRLPWKSKLVTCPHCDKTGGSTAMKRHHFTHCKFKEKDQ
jgi:hypothetical protein